MEPRVQKHTCTTSSNSLKSKLFTNFHPWSRVSALPRRPAAYKAAALLAELTRRTLSTVLFYHEFSIFTTARWEKDRLDRLTTLKRACQIRMPFKWVFRFIYWIILRRRVEVRVVTGRELAVVLSLASWMVRSVLVWLIDPLDLVVGFLAFG